MTYKQVTFTYAGIELDTFSDSKGNCYITTGSLAKGLGRTAKHVRNFFEAKPEYDQGKVLVKVGRGRSNSQLVPAYPVETISQLYTYWAMLGHKRSIALLAASAAENLLNRVEEAHGLGKAVEVREERLALNYQAMLAKVMELEVDQMGNPERLPRDYVDSEEYIQTTKMAYAREKLEKLQLPKIYNKSQRAMFRKSLEKIYNEYPEAVGTMLDHYNVTL